MKTVKIELPNTLLQSLLAFCAALNIRKVEVLDEEALEDAALYRAMQEADRSEKVPFEAAIAKLRQKSGR